ncbi:MAG: acyl-CoA dehydrogenase family protein, partial [Methylophilaceae bacterium]
MNELVKLVEESATRLFKDFSEAGAYDSMEAGTFPIRLWNDFLTDGWLRTTLAEEDDGAGLGLAGGYVLMRLAGYYAAPIPIMEPLLGLYLLSQAGMPLTDELFIPVVLDDDSIGDNISITGVPWARDAAGLVVVFTSNGSTYINLLRPENYTVITSQNMAGEPRDDVQLNVNPLDGAEQLNGDITASQISSWLALGKSVMTAGALQRVLERTVEYATERSQFGRQIGKFQAVQQQLAVQAELTSASNCAVDAAIGHIGTAQEWELIACAKITTAEAAGYAAKTAHAVHAAIGFTHEYPLQLSTRRLWS